MDADAGQLALDAGRAARALDAGTIWQDLQGYIGAFWATISANNAAPLLLRRSALAVLLRQQFL